MFSSTWTSDHGIRWRGFWSCELSIARSSRRGTVGLTQCSQVHRGWWPKAGDGRVLHWVSTMETDEEVVWNGAPAQQDLLMTESEDDSEVALLQMLDISSDLDDEFVDSDGESEADQQALQMKTREKHREGATDGGMASATLPRGRQAASHQQLADSGAAAGPGCSRQFGTLLAAADPVDWTAARAAPNATGSCRARVCE